MSTAERTELQREWLSYPDAQTVSGLGRTTLWKLIRGGKIKAARVGRAVRISRRSLEEFMEHQATQPQLPGFEDAEPYTARSEEGGAEGLSPSTTTKTS